MASTNCYDEARKRLSSLGAIQNIQEQQKKRAEDREALGRAFLGDRYDTLDDEVREASIVQAQEDPSLGQELLQEHFDNLNQEVTEAANLESIIHDAPFDKLAKTMALSYNPGETSEDLAGYHSFFYLANQIDATEQAANRGEADPRSVKKLEKVAMGMAMERFRQSYADKDERTKAFIEKFVESVLKSGTEFGRDFAAKKFEKYAGEAQKYLTDENNESEIRNYLKKDTPEDQRSNVYENLVLAA